MYERCCIVIYLHENLIMLLHSNTSTSRNGCISNTLNELLSHRYEYEIIFKTRPLTDTPNLCFINN